MKVLLVGTPNFTIATFTKVIENFDVVGVVAQPSRPSGRGLIVTEPPAIILAKSKRLKIFQPEKIIDIYDELSKLDIDVIITMAYGQIIPKKILDLPKKGSYNIHGSILPKYRGASPVQYALLNGDKTTGITFMEMNEKMDEGDIIFQEEVDINEEDNFDSLLKKLSNISALNIVSWLKNIDRGSFEKKPQDSSQATYSPKISKEDERLEFDTMENTINKIRALSSTPGAYLVYNAGQAQFRSIVNARIKVFKATKEPMKNAPEVHCKDGILYATEYQFEGRKKVTLV